MREKIEYYAVSGLLKLTKIMPKLLVYKTFTCIAMAIFYLIPRRRRLTKANLAYIYPSWDEGKITSTCKECYTNMAHIISESILFMQGRIELKTSIKNYEEVAQKFAKIKKPMLFFTGHFGNWELLVNFIGSSGHPVNLVGRKGNNKLIEDNIVTPFRNTGSNTLIHKEGGGIRILRSLKRGLNVGILIDQKSGGKGSLKAKFMGKDADTLDTVAALKLSLNPSVIPIFLVRTGFEEYEVKMYDPCEYLGDDGDTKTQQIQKMTQKYNDILEEVVRTHPSQWFWMHNRWRLDLKGTK